MDFNIEVKPIEDKENCSEVTVTFTNGHVRRTIVINKPSMKILIRNTVLQMVCKELRDFGLEEKGYQNERIHKSEDIKAQKHRESALKWLRKKKSPIKA